MASRKTLFVVALLLLAAVAILPATGPDSTTSEPDATTVTILDDSGEARGTVSVTVADTPGERYEGLSNTESLAPNEGMLFVFPKERQRAFVMRNMSFPIDIVFVDSEKRITRIHNAPVESDDDDLTKYTGRAQWVLEVPYEWTDDHDVTVGDTIEIEGHDNTSNTTTDSPAVLEPILATPS